MSLERMNPLVKTPEKEQLDASVDFINQQLVEATAEEDYEQAVALRDFLKYRQEHGISSEIEMMDLLTFEDDNFGKMSLDDPKYRAWVGIDAKRSAARLEGKDVVDNSDISDYLIGGYAGVRELDKDLYVEFKAVQNIRGGARVDLLLNVRKKLEEAKYISSLAKEKLDKIWQPYRKQIGFNGPEYEEFKSAYLDYQLKPDQKDALDDNTPDSILIPVSYWQGIYDNSRFILDSLQKTVEELEK